MRVGSLAKALWGSGGSGLSMKQLLGLRLSTVHRLHKDKKGVSMRNKETPRSLDSQQQGCQAKQARHDKADTDVCQLSGKCSGTVWHRRFLCEHWHDSRAKYVSPGMLIAAAAMQLAGQGLDRAASGLFPFPLERVPRPFWNARSE
eukprot:747679-Pyramimonas_sp.AAC.1